MWGSLEGCRREVRLWGWSLKLGIYVGTRLRRRGALKCDRSQMCGVRGSHIRLGTGVTRRMAEGRNSQGSQLSLIGLAPEVELV